MLANFVELGVELGERSRAVGGLLQIRRVGLHQYAYLFDAMKQQHALGTERNASKLGRDGLWFLLPATSHVASIVL